MPANDGPSRLPAQTGSPDAFLEGSELQRLSGLVTPSSIPANLPRKVEMPDKDPFGLLEIEDTYERLLGRGFKQAANLAANVVAKMDKKARKAWAAGKCVELPEKSLGDLYSFRMTAQQGPKAACQYISFYRSDDPGVTNRGFTIHKKPDGHLVLRDESRGDVNPGDDETYGDMVEKATRWIHDYAKQFGYQPEYLMQPVVQQTRRNRAGQFIARRLKTVADFRSDRLPSYRPEPVRAHQYLNSSTEGKTRSKLSRPALFGRMLVVGAFLPVPAVSSGLMQDGALSHLPKPISLELLDDSLNREEHIRQGFDAKGLHLPTEGIEVANMGSGVAIGFDPTLSEALLRAPSVNADSNSTQDVIGGVRKATNLSKGWGDELEGSDCEDIIVDLGPNASVRAVTADSASRDKLSIYLDRQRIRICNRTNGAMGESQLKNVYFEVHSG